MMFHKKLFKTWLLFVIFSIVGILLSVIIVDPLDILGSPIIHGINNYKSKQGNYTNVFKPYQILKFKPDIIFVGTSRIHRAWEPVFKNYDANKIYNLGVPALPLDNMEKYLDFAYDINKPKEVYIGLDFFQFGKKNFYGNTRNFSEDRLKKLSSNDERTIYLEMLKENFQVSNTIIETISKSLKNKDKIEISKRGWDANHDDHCRLDVKEYYNTISGYMISYQDWQYEPQSIKILKRIVQKAKQNNVDLYIFFNPISVDLIALIDMYELNDDLDFIKQEVTSIVGKVYDFNHINEATLDRYGLFIDASHCNTIFGEIMKERIINGVDTEQMILLTPDNVQEKLALQHHNNNKWINNNITYIEYLKQRSGSRGRLKVGELKEFIGF